MVFENVINADIKGMLGDSRMISATDLGQGKGKCKCSDLGKGTGKGTGKPQQASVHCEGVAQRRKFGGRFLSQGYKF